jgi:ankyrin repeat protein
MSGSSHSLSAPPGTVELEVLFPELEIGALLGRGGMGFVYGARQRSLDRRVALKLVRVERAFPERRERFESEVQALARLNHPHIVALFDVGERDGWLYLLMELIEGEDLECRLRRGPLPPRQALAVALQVCGALAHAHEAGVVHRDVKPANILFGTGGEVKLGDFGLAKLLQNPPADGTGSGLKLGTPHYMPPEQRRDAWGVDERADVYALGVVLYEMLTGRLPEGRFLLPSRKCGTGRVLDETVLKAMASEPAYRFQSAQAMHDDLERAAHERAASRRYQGVLAAVLVLAGITAAICFTGGRQRDLPAARSLKRGNAVQMVKSRVSGSTTAAAREDRNEMHAAVESGDRHRLAELVRDGEPLDQADRDGWTPMLLAVAEDRADLMEVLLVAGASTGMELPGRKTEMHLAAGRGAVKAAAWLKAHGAGLEQRDLQGWRPLDWAAACLHADMVRWLAQQGAGLLEGGEGETPLGLGPLHLAAAAGGPVNLNPEQASWRIVQRQGEDEPERCAETVRALLDQGASPHELDAEKLSPLHHAAAANQSLAVALLIERGADANHVPPPEALTPMAVAAAANATAAMRVLFAMGGRAHMPVEMESPLHKAARGGHPEAVTLLLEHGAEVNRQDLTRATPLHRAAANGRPEVLAMLLERGAALNPRDNRRATPLHHAAAAGKLEAVRLLCEKGSAMAVRDMEGNTAADLAERSGHGGVVALLESYEER